MPAYMRNGVKQNSLETPKRLTPICTEITIEVLVSNKHITEITINLKNRLKTSKELNSVHSLFATN